MSKTILIVEDESDLLETITDVFKEQGYEVFTATDGETGLEKAIKIKPNVILLDLVMPKVGGVEMLRRLRDHEWGASASVVVLTAHDNDANLIEAQKSHVAKYVIKSSVGIDELVSTVDRVVAEQSS